MAGERKEGSGWHQQDKLHQPTKFLGLISQDSSAAPFLELHSDSLFCCFCGISLYLYPGAVYNILHSRSALGIKTQGKGDYRNPLGPALPPSIAEHKREERRERKEKKRKKEEKKKRRKDEEDRRKELKRAIAIDTSDSDSDAEKRRERKRKKLEKIIKERKKMKKKLKERE